MKLLVVAISVTRFRYLSGNVRKVFIGNFFYGACPGDWVAEWNLLLTGPKPFPYLTQQSVSSTLLLLLLYSSDVMHKLHTPRFAPDDCVSASLPVTLILGEDIRYPNKPDLLVITNYRIIVDLSRLSTRPSAKKEYYDVTLINYLVHM